MLHVNPDLTPVRRRPVFPRRVLPMVGMQTIENFCTHARNGYYDGVIFHRVIKGFMGQTVGLPRVFPSFPALRTAAAARIAIRMPGRSGWNET